MNRTLSPILCWLCAAFSLHAFEVRQVFRAERFTRGNVNIRPQQTADRAAWIWIDDGGPVPGEVDAVRFSCDFAARSVPPVIDVSGDERFILFLDGKEIARGPHKGAVNHWYYQTYAVDGLAEGTRHVLEALVYRMDGGRPTGVLSAGRGGFIVKAEDPYDGALTTGRAKWRAVRARGTKMKGFGDSRTFGGSAESEVYGTGLADPAAASGASCAVKVTRIPVTENRVGVARPDWALFPTERPDQISVERRPGEFKAGQPRFCHADAGAFYRADDAHFPLVAEMNALLKEGRAVMVPPNTSARLIWDLGDYWCAYPLLEVSGGAGSQIRWGWAEGLYDKDNLRGVRGEFDGKRCAHALRDLFLPDGRAHARFTSPWWRCGRWCEFEVKTADEPLALTSLSFLEVRYPLAERASFECDDPSIADIWRICRRGVENCSHETYMDCPYFEQQMYPGDTRVVMLIVDAMSGDPRLNRFGIGLFDYARRENGLVPMNYPCRTMQESSTYSMCWVLMLGDHALWHGDREWLKARVPGMRHTLHALAGYANGEGLLEDLPGWSFMDWVPGWAQGNAPDGERGCSAVNNLLFVYALGHAAAIEDAMGDSAMAAYWRTKRDALASAVMARFWSEERGMVADTAAKDCFSEHAQCLALLSGVLPTDKERRALEGLIGSGDLARATVYFSHYLFDTYIKYGRADLMLKRFDLWRDYVKMDLKTPLEKPGDTARSDCHAWGSHPIYHLLTGVAGMKPDSFGFGSVRISPKPGPLKWIKASMPTPKGMVWMDLRFAEGNVTGTVSLPDGLPGTFAWKGGDRPLRQGVNEIR